MYFFWFILGMETSLEKVVQQKNTCWLANRSWLLCQSNFVQFFFIYWTLKTNFQTHLQPGSCWSSLYTRPTNAWLDGHGNIWFPHRKHGQTSLWDIQVNCVIRILNSAWYAAKHFICHYLCFVATYLKEQWKCNKRTLRHAESTSIFLKAY